MRLLLGMMLLSLSCTIAFAQEPTSAVPKIIPPSPEASNLGKFVEVPISLYTGTPDISIPLYEMASGSLNVKVNLSYHASGIKVDEMASWVGIGWALNAGGVLTRTVRGKPDDNSGSYGTGFFQYAQGKTFAGFLNLPDNAKATVLQEIADNSADLQPDQYFVNVNGISAQFTYDWDGTLVQTEDKSLKIVRIQDTGGSNPYKITGWDIIDDKGTVYKFRDAETTLSDPQGSVGPVRNGTFVSSWYITQIVDVNNENIINFTYDDYILDYGLKGGATITHNLHGCSCHSGLPAGELFQSNTRTVVNGKRIKEIYTDDNSQKITFNTGATRTDTDQISSSGTTTNFKLLDNIVLTNANSEEIKTFKLNFGYGTGRLTLNSVTPQKNNQNVSPPFQLSYNSLQLPPAGNFSYGLYAQDHWGYFNGQMGNPNLIPPAVIVNTYEETPTIYATGADRTPSATNMVAASLSRITYPTGGYDQFTYEPHQYGYVQSLPLLYYPPSRVIFSAAANEQTDIVSPNTSFTDTEYFTVVANPAKPLDKVPVSYSFIGSSDAATLAKKATVKLFKVGDTNPIKSEIFGYDSQNPVRSGGAVVELDPGNYYLEAKVNLFADPVDFVSIEVNYETWGAPITTRMVGGLRIKRIDQYASASDPNYVTRQFKYTMESDTTRSAGVIYQEPIYNYTVVRYCFIGGSQLWTNYVDYVRLASNVTMLGTTQGSHIGYREVEVSYGRGSTLNGKTRAKFSSPYDYTDVIFETLPHRPPESRSYSTGLTFEQKDYKYETSQYGIVKSTVNQYNFLEPFVTGITAMFLGGPVQADHFVWGSYGTYYGKGVKSKTTETIYPTANNTGAQVNVTDYTYDSKLSHVQTEVTTAATGVQTKKEYFYAPNYDFSPNSVITQMKSLNMVGVPIETIFSRNTNVVGASYMGYTFSNNKIRLSNQLSLAIASPITFLTKSIDVVNSVPDSRYLQEIQLDAYDSKGNPLQYTARDGISYSFVWGYDSKYPIAEVKGASVTQIFHTSFEDATGITGGSKTGNKYYNSGTYSITSPPTATTNLVMTFWYYDGQWKFQSEIPYSSTVTKAGATRLDEVRVYPKGAQIRTFTYDPLIGSTSVCDANNLVTFYKYDAANRLRLISDNDNNLLKTFQYHYKGQ